MILSTSPSRTYVAMCIDERGEYYFRKFVLPDEDINNSSSAALHYMNHIDRTTVVVGAMAFEQYQNIAEAVKKS